MTTVQIADLLGVSERQVKELIKSGELKAQTVGGVWEVDRRQVASLAKRIGQKAHNHKDPHNHREPRDHKPEE